MQLSGGLRDGEDIFVRRMHGYSVRELSDGRQPIWDQPAGFVVHYKLGNGVIK
jgi:hypothetical protein